MKQQEIRLLACDEEVLNEADDILGDELAKLNRYSRYCYIIRWSGGRWRLNRKYMHLELTEERYRYVHGEDGHRQLRSSLVWTEKGRQFIGGLIWRQ